MRYTLFVCTLLVWAGVRAGQPVIRGITADSAAIGCYGHIELTVDVDATYTNPFDYDDIAVRGIFTGPKGATDTVDGFFMQDYSLDTASGRLTSKGKGGFRVRYSPTQIGRWKYALVCVTKSGSTAKRGGTFTCYSTSSPGFIRRNASPYLSFDNGSVYIPIGENMGWAAGNPYRDYSRWVSGLSRSKGNFVRVWMPSWGLGLEWLNGHNGYAGLERYKQENAFYLDWLIDYCDEKGVYMMLSLDHHGQVSTKVDPNWNENPYNAANGGPCVNTWDFFTSERARQLIRNRFRYIVARYGYSRNIACWELFNEVDWTDDFKLHKGQVTDWHREMARWLSHLDVNRHLLTTSYGMAVNDPASWTLPELDFTQTHFYSERPLDSVLSQGTRTYREAYGKPTLNGEFGLNGDGHALPGLDPGGIYVHNSLWASLLAGAMGPALPWYWDNYIDPQHLYEHFSAVADFAAGLDLIGGGYLPAAVTADTALAVYALRSADSSRLAAWVLNRAYNWRTVRERGVPSAVSGASVLASAMKNGDYAIRWIDCHSGAEVGTTTVKVTDHVMRCVCPSVKWDLAVTVSRIEK